MIKGIGSDVIETSRIKRAIERHGHHFLDRLFTPKEQDYCLRHRESFRRFAGRFAAKEAVVKCLGVGFSNGIGWQDVEIVNDEMGKPIVHLSEKILSLFPNASILLSITDSESSAFAVAIYTNQRA